MPPLTRSHIGLAMALALVWPAPGSALDVYVATTGSDKNPGTETQPKATIAAGVGRLPRGGGTVFIRGGTYPQSKTLNINVAGASNAARTIIRSYTGETAVIEGSEGNTVSIDAPFVTLSGLEIRQAEPAVKGEYGILIWKQHDVTVSGCTIHHIRNSGIFVGSDDYDPVAKTSSAKNLLFEGNTVHHACYNNSDQVKRPGWGQGVSSFFSVGTIYRNNKVYKNWGEGINVCCNDSALVEGNVIYDNYSVNIYLDHATNATIRNNLLYTSDDKDHADFFPYWSKTTSPGNGILLANEETKKQTNSGHKIYNNITINCGSGVHISGSLTNSLIANNTFVVGAAWGIGIGGGEEAVTCSLLSNIVFSSGRALGGVSPKGQWTSDYNLWFGGPHSGTKGAHDIRVNPLFVAGTGLLADGYRLQVASPAINAGTPVSDVVKDHWGTSRPQGTAVDIGACEFTAGGGSSALRGEKDEKAVGEKTVARTGGAPKAPPPAKLALNPDALAAWDQKLFARLRESLAAGKRHRFTIVSQKKQFTLMRIEKETELVLELDGGKLPVPFKMLELPEKCELACDLAQSDTQGDHSLAAFYLLAANRADRAEDHLAKAGPLSTAVRSAFRVEDNGAPAGSADAGQTQR